jgi:amidase
LSDYAYRSATDLASDIRAKKLSPVEVVEAAIDRIEERNSSLNAIIFKGYDDAREAAARAEEAISAGEEVGPLHGVPVVMKDLFDFKPGWPTTMGGLPPLANVEWDFYCVWAERMEAAGAIIVGKGNSPIMGYRGACDNPLFGPTANPFDTDRNSGGSSGGPAAAVADGMVPIAEGTDGGGSIRIPSAWCGTYGFQPSASRVPTVVRPNGFSGTSPFIYEGPITRNVADAALALTALSGPHPADPYGTLEKEDFTQATNRSIEGWKIAYSPDLGVFPVESVIAETVEEAVRAFEEAGAEVVPVEVDIDIDQHDLSDLWCRLIMPLSLDGFANLKAQGIDIIGDHSDILPPGFLRWYHHVEKMTAMEYFDDNSMRTRVYDALQAVMGEYDLLVSPTVAAMPTRNQEDGLTRGPTEINGVEVDPLIGWCMTYFTNFTGHPAASVPAGLSPEGLPIGMQIMGRRRGDADVLAASAAFERVRPWSHTYEKVANRQLG